MTNSKAGPGTNIHERVRSFLVLMATLGMILFHWTVVSGAINGVPPAAIFAKYTTLVTPAEWAFSIWSLIYLGLFAFSVYQLLPSQIERFRPIRLVYIVSCVLNCLSIDLWQFEMIGASLTMIVVLWLVLLFITSKLMHVRGLAETWVVQAPFGLYFGWITTAALTQFAVMLVYLGSPPSVTAGAVLLALGAAAAIMVRIRFRNFFFPLSIAWAATAIAVRNSSETAIVVVSAFVVVAALVTAGSVVTTLEDSTSE